MKKDTSILLIVIMVLVLVGIPKSSINIPLLENSYFDIINECIKSGNITSSTVEQIITKAIPTNSNSLKKYIYNGEYNSLYQNIVYRYSTNNETLKVEYNLDDAKMNKVIYETFNKNHNFTLTFNSYEKHNFTMNLLFSDLSEVLSLSKIVLDSTNSDYKLYDMYCKISKKIHNKENLALSEIVEAVPEVNVIKYDNTHITLKAGKEYLCIDNNSALYKNKNLSISNTRNSKIKLDIYVENIKEQQKIFMLID